MTAEGLPDPNDSAGMDRFLAAADAFLVATSAKQLEFREVDRDIAEEVATTESIVIGAIRSQPLLQLPAQLETFPYSPERMEPYSAEEADAIRRGRVICEWISEAAVSVPESWGGGIREIIGETLQGVENPEQQAAWLQVLRDACQPFGDIDEILGPDPGLVILQLVAQREQEMEETARRNAEMKKRQQFATQVIDVYTGFDEHDETPRLRQVLVTLCTLQLENFAEQLQARSLLEELEGIAGRRPRASKEILMLGLTGLINNIRTELNLYTLGEGLPPSAE
jgi:hypothetical protein